MKSDRAAKQVLETYSLQMTLFEASSSWSIADAGVRISCKDIVMDEPHNSGPCTFCPVFSLSQRTNDWQRISEEWN